MGRASLGAFRSTPLGIVAAEGKPTPVRALLNLRQARFAQRLLSRPRNQRGPEEVMERQGAALTTRLRGAATLRPGETAGGMTPVLPGQCSGRREGERPPDSQMMEEEPGFSVDGRIAAGQRESGSSSGVVEGRGLRGPPLLHREKQRGIRRRGLRNLQGVEDSRTERREWSARSSTTSAGGVGAANGSPGSTLSLGVDPGPCRRGGVGGGGGGVWMETPARPLGQVDV